MQHVFDKKWKLGFSTRADGDLRNAAFRQAFLHRTFGFTTDNLVTAQQIHGDTVAVVDEQNRGDTIANVDGLVYKVAGLAPIVLGVRVADCVPILLIDEEAGVIAAVHAGWKGTVAGISSKAVATMKSLGADPAHMRAIIGPHIEVCCYDVPKERGELFRNTFAGRTDVVVSREGKEYLSLGRANVYQLVGAGIPASAIDDTSLCTASNVSKLFSFRADSTENFGEQMGFIGYNHE